MNYELDGEEFETQAEYLEALRRHPLYKNSYLPWSEEEDRRLLDLSRSMSPKDLALHFKRRVGAINSRLSKLQNRIVAETAIEIIESLIEGFNPVTGEVFDSRSPWMDKGIKADLIEFLEAINDKTPENETENSGQTVNEAASSLAKDSLSEERTEAKDIDRQSIPARDPPLIRNQCISCGNEIPAPRLAALPETKMCVTCSEGDPQGSQNRTVLETWGSRDDWRSDRASWKKTNT